RYAPVIVKPTPQFSEWCLGAQKVLGRTPAQCADKPGPHQIQLLIEVLPAMGGFIGQRRAVSRGTATQDIANIHFLSLETESSDDAVEQRAGGADERFALGVFVRARRFAYKAKLGPRLAIPEHGLGTSRNQFGTTVTTGHLLGQHC